MCAVMHLHDVGVIHKDIKVRGGRSVLVAGIERYLCFFLGGDFTGGEAAGLVEVMLVVVVVVLT